MGSELLGRVKRFGAAGLLLLIFLTFACGSPQAPPIQTPKAKSAAEDSTDPLQVERSDIGFASRETLVDHYQKHGREFGTVTMTQYLKMAQRLRDLPSGGAIQEATRSDGVITRYDRETGDFIAFNRDCVIRTYFRPTDGEAYFKRQVKKRHGSVTSKR